MIRPFFLAIFCLISSSANACEYSENDPNYIAVNVENFVFFISPRPEQINIGEQFELSVSPCSKANSFQIKSVTGLMPAHGHGLNYKPQIDSAYGVKGMLLHMPGKWEINIKGELDGEPFNALYAFDLMP